MKNTDTITSANYFRMPTAVLEAWIAVAEDDDDISPELFDRIEREVELRSISDDRIAQGQGTL